MKPRKWRRRKTCATPANQPRSRSNLTRAKRKDERYTKRLFELILAPLRHPFFPTNDFLEKLITVEPMSPPAGQVHYMNKKT